VTNAVRTYPLDTSASIMPAVTNAGKTSFFRFEAVLKEPIDRERLQKTVAGLQARWGHVFVTLKKTWNTWVLVPMGEPPRVETDGPTDCHGLDVHRPGTPLIRFRVNGPQLALECSHLAVDGIAALKILLAVVTGYLREEPLSPTNEILEEEYEDPFFRHAVPGTPWPVRPPRAWRVQEERLPVGQYRTTRLELSLGGTKARAAGRGLTVTEYLATIHLLCLHRLYVAEKARPGRRTPGKINLMIPVDLRTAFPSATLRNFIGMVVVSLDPERDLFTFEAVANAVRKAIRGQKRPEGQLKQISRNATAAKNPLVRWLPRVVKAPLQRILYRFFGDGLVTSHLTNVGKLSDEGVWGAQLKAVRFIPGGSTRSGVSMAVISLGDTLCLTVGSLLQESQFENELVGCLIAENLAPRVDGGATNKAQ